MQLLMKSPEWKLYNVVLILGKREFPQDDRFIYLPQPRRLWFHLSQFVGWLVAPEVPETPRQ